MRSPRYLIAILGMMVLGAGCRAPAEKATPVDSTADVEAQIDSLLAQMTLEEKVGMIHASSSFTSGGVERLGIPELVMSDGPHGVRHEHTRSYDKATDVATSVKHYIANSLEYERKKVDVQMDERTLREIYLPAFQAAVQEGGALTVMAAYNRFRGDWCAQSEYLLDDVLKGELGFEGLVMSDWSAVNDTMEAVQAGLDIEMGTDLGQEWGKPDYGAFYMGDAVVDLVEDGTVDEELIDGKARRILRVMHAIHIFTGDRPPGAYNTPEHQAIARRVADESIVLLENEGLLPLHRDSIETLAVIGANASRKHAGGGGSSEKDIRARAQVEL